MPSLYDATIPAFLRGFATLGAIIDKARAYAREQGMDEAELTGARLIEDMAPFTAQVQRCSDTAKGVAVRIGQIEGVAMPDEEVTFDDLKARIDKTVAFLKSVPRESFDGRDHAEVILTTPSGDIPFTAETYALGFAMPNFYFHLTTAYALLRMKGVPIGKLDYLGRA
ncbi:MAG: DUF1993 domain-containing protein [Sphingomonas sp.]